MDYGPLQMTRYVPSALKGNCLFHFVLAVILLASCTTTERVGMLRLSEDPISYFRIEEISSQLLPHMDVLDKGKYNFVVMDDETPNAYVISGHTILVNRGILRLFNDSELACVLAHEIAHVSLSHNARRMSAYNSRERVFIELERSSPDTGLLSSVLKPFAIKAYSKQQETKADIEAVRAIRILGISPEVYVTFLRKLAQHSEQNNEGNGGGLLDDHPSIDSRIESIQNAGFLKD